MCLEFIISKTEAKALCPLLRCVNTSRDFGGGSGPEGFELSDVVVP